VTNRGDYTARRRRLRIPLSRSAAYDAGVTSLRLLRLVAFTEGVSFLTLLFIAMPLKYLAGLPMAVRVVGMIHGVLFIVFVLVLIWASIARTWPVRRWLLAFVSSIVPFGTFFFDRSLRREIAGAAREESIRAA
jgi:integral membrane protein